MYRLIFLAVVFIAVCDASEKKTECQMHRERETKSHAPLLMRLIPECDENGDYMPKQCFLDSEFCVCWDKSGNPVTQPSKKIKSCNCLVQQYEARKKGLTGVFIPQCSEDGKYKKVQCHTSTGHCWCAHPETGAVLSDSKRGTPNC